MKILQIHNRYRQAGGEDVVVASEAELLREAGHQLIQYQVENPSSNVAAGGALTVASWNRSSARRIRELVAEIEPDVAHVHNTWFRLSPSVFAELRRANVPVVATVHNYRYMCANALLYRDGAPCELCVAHTAWAGFRHRCYRDSFAASAASAIAIEATKRRHVWERNIDLLLALTGFAKRRLVAAGLSADRVTVKPNFVPDPGKRANPPSFSKTVLFVGRLSEEKGGALALEAWRDWGRAGLELVVVGEGPQRAELEANAPPGVRFVGQLPRPDVGDLLRSARALLFPSRWYEGQPMVLLEGFAAGLPVIANNLGAMPELLAATPGWLASAPDKSIWVEQLDRLLSPTEVDKTGGALRRTYENRFTPGAAIENLTRAYEVASSVAARR